MADEWLTYKEAAAVLGVSAENVRHRAIRGRWPRRVGNDKRAKIQLPESPNPVRTPREPPREPPSEQGSNPQTIKALQARVEDLIAELAGARGELGGVREALGEARARADAADTRAAEIAADLAVEKARAGRAIEAFAALADRLDTLAEARRPWWRRLAG
jgi:hypothetical protein